MFAWIRTGLFWVGVVIATFVVCTSLIAVAAVNPNSPKLDWILTTWSRIWFRLGGVKFTVEGATVDPSRSYVIVSNHQSNFDIMASLLAVPVPGRFLAKKELFRVPILGAAMRAIGMICVDRNSQGSSILEQLNAEASANLSAARSIIVYAEGTRSKTGELRRFKRGGFTIAINEQMPILPVTIAGSYAAWPPGSPLRGGPITARVHEPIETTGMTKDDIGNLADQVHSIIESDLADLHLRS